MAEDDYRADLRGLLRRTFSQYSGEPKMSEAQKQDYRARSRALTLAAKLRSHIEKHQDKWVAAEEKQLRQKHALKARHGLAGGPKPPPGAATRRDARLESIADQARSRVEARSENRLKALRERALKSKFNQQRTPQGVQARSQSRGRSASRT